MGSTYANLLVRVDPAGAVSAERVADVIRSSLLADSETSEVDEGSANRTITIASRAGTPWIGVFDQAADSIDDEDALLGLGRGLSTGLGTIVVATAVFDSDLALAWLIDGTVVDQVARPIDVLEDMVGVADGAEGNPARWATAFPGIDPAALLSAWETDDGFAESRLIAAGALLDVPLAWADSGYRYLADADDPGDLTALHFRSPRASQAGESALGDSIGFVDRLAFEVGDRIDHSISIIGGTGGPDGIMLVVGGDALRSGLVQIDRAQFISAPVSPESLRAGPIDVALSDGLTGSEAVRYGSAVVRQDDPEFPSSSADTLVIRLFGTAMAAGHGALEVTFGQKERFEQAQFTMEVHVEVLRGSSDA